MGANWKHEVLFRPLRLEEVSEALALLAADELRTLDDDAWTVVELQAWIASEPELCVAAVRDGVLVGVCLAHLHAAANKLHIEDLVVDHAARRSGLARTLITLVLKAAHERLGSELRAVALVSVENRVGGTVFDRLDFETGQEMLWMQQNASFPSA